MAWTNSRRTGGGVCIKAWIKGRVFWFDLLLGVDSDEYGTDCWASMFVRGANQLNKSKQRLRELSNLAIVFLGGPYLVMERLDTVLFNLRSIDFSRGPRAFSDNFPRNVA